MTSEDFEEPIAKELYNILEQCYLENSLSLSTILNRCSDDRVSSLIVSAISLGEFKDENESTIQDSIKMFKRRNLEKQRELLMQRIRAFTVQTDDDKNQLNAMLEEKIKLDKKLKC